MRLIAEDEAVKVATKAVVMVAAISMLVTLAACTGASSPSGSEKRKVKASTGKTSDMWMGETTVTVDGIQVKVSAVRHKEAYPDRLPDIIATNNGPEKSAVMQWFAPLQATEDTHATPSTFYPSGSQWVLVDLKGNKKGKLSIDKFGGIYYLRTSPGETSERLIYEVADTKPIIDDFIKAHGGLPDATLTVTSQAFEEGSPSNPGEIVRFQRGYGHRFNNIDIWDDTIETGMSKLPGAHYYRRWHEFKAEGGDKILLGPASSQVIAQRVVSAYKKDWQARPDKFKDLLSGKTPLGIELRQLVYFDPRPRDLRRFYDIQIMYQPGWIVQVSNIEIPPLIVNAINGNVYERKPKGENKFR